LKFDKNVEEQTVKKQQERFNRLRPKMEIIADRLDKIINPEQGPESPTSLKSKGSALGHRNSILYESKSGDIVFDANKFFDVLDINNDGVLSFAEINEILCLSDEQLKAFIATMNERTGATSGQQGEVSRVTFVRGFLDALAGATQLEPSVSETEDLFGRIAEEVGTTESGGIQYRQLYSSSLSLFLSDLQILAIINKFKQRYEGKKGISKDEFVECYPIFLGEVVQQDPASLGSLVQSTGGYQVEPGLDVTFENLCLTVTVGNKEVNVVDDVSGRLRSNTMTAVMGGSGSGKSSLLNALCGRAFYGKVTGTVKINGHESKIEEHKPVIGFVPQEDIVYPDLTVRENLIYSGRLQLPAGTSEQEIAELADATMASLGLSRIANSLVGDARRRGVSGGEKKRVNVGLELMKRPKILFLDEPTSGLDSRSAFVVMESLKRLVTTQGMTVATVIHQPRTDIYDMFDSLFLLGVGGCTVYHGPATECRSYFESLGFHLQEGDSQADWFLDISSGDVEAGDVEAGDMNQLDTHKKAMSSYCFEVALYINEEGIGLVLGQPDGVERGNFVVKEVGQIRHARVSVVNDIQVGDKVVGINGQGLCNMTLEDVEALLSHLSSISEHSFVLVNFVRKDEEDHSDDSFEDESKRISPPLQPDKPSNVDGALAKARVAREKLYRQWNVHFENAPMSHREKYYSPPEVFPLPRTPKAVPTWRQLLVQLRRNCLLTWRNRDSRLIDSMIFFVAVFFIEMVSAPGPDKWNYDPRELTWILFISSPNDASAFIRIVFFWALFGIYSIVLNAAIVGVIASVLIGLNSTKIITDKKLEFYREAQSGVSVTAFYIAANITSTIEQGIVAVAGAALSYSVANPSSTFTVYLWNYFMLSWLSVAWGHFFSIIVPQGSVTIVVAFYNAAIGLLFCGALGPGTFLNLYHNTGIAVIAGLFSPLRFFVESMAVSEATCLPVQGGYTIGSNAFNFTSYEKEYSYWWGNTYMAHTSADNNVDSSALEQHCGGWFWWLPASIAVGIMIRIAGGIAIHCKDRSKQGKKTLLLEAKEDFSRPRSMKALFQSFILTGIVLFLVLAGFLVLSIWLILRTNPEEHPNNPEDMNMHRLIDTFSSTY